MKNVSLSANVDTYVSLCIEIRKSMHRLIRTGEIGMASMVSDVVDIASD